MLSAPTAPLTPVKFAGTPLGRPLLYAVQPHRYQTESPIWRDYRQYLYPLLKPAVRRWLLDEGSLTQRLITVSQGHFSVRIINQGWQRPTLSESQLLGRPANECAIIREVALCCFDLPWVFARSVMPASSLTGHLRQLRHFDNRSLGQMLFNDRSMQRRPFELAILPGDSKYLPTELRAETCLWGRRSRFELAAKPLMVSEVFLPTFKPWQ